MGCDCNSGNQARARNLPGTIEALEQEAILISYVLVRFLFVCFVYCREGWSLPTSTSLLDRVHREPRNFIPATRSHPQPEDLKVLVIGPAMANTRGIGCQKSPSTGLSSHWRRRCLLPFS